MFSNDGSGFSYSLWWSSLYNNNEDHAFKAAFIPIPGAVWLFGSALAGLGWLRRKQTAYSKLSWSFRKHIHALGFLCFV